MFFIFIILVFSAPIFAAIPVVSGVWSADPIQYSSESAPSDEHAGNFAITGDSLKTPFRLQLFFENCEKLLDKWNHTVPLTSIKLKYFSEKIKSYETISLHLTGKERNCSANVQFYEDIQKVYNMELWINWNKQKAPGGTFYGRTHIIILPK